jgi:hypothetical protein
LLHFRLSHTPAEGQVPLRHGLPGGQEPPKVCAWACVVRVCVCVRVCVSSLYAFLYDMSVFASARVV